MSDFWQNLPRPFWILAPMEDVTDTVFRQVIRQASNANFRDSQNSQVENVLGENSQKAGKNLQPDVLFTEFTNCEGMQSVGRSKLIHRLRYSEGERPLVAQVWGVTPQDYYQTARLILELGFDGIDINMGCPVKNVIKQGACSALIKNPLLAKEIVAATKAGVEDKIPVSIKTRIGFNQIQTQEWCGFLLQECRPSVLTVHGRTVKEESKVPCHWDQIGKVVKLRDQIFANSAINSSLKTNPKTPSDLKKEKAKKAHWLSKIKNFLVENVGE